MILVCPGLAAGYFGVKNNSEKGGTIPEPTTYKITIQQKSPNKVVINPLYQSKGTLESSSCEEFWAELMVNFPDYTVHVISDIKTRVEDSDLSIFVPGKVELLPKNQNKGKISCNSVDKQICTLCRKKVNPGAIFCKSCYYPLQCSYCGIFGVPLVGGLCLRCLFMCENCDKNLASPGNTLCIQCSKKYQCQKCRLSKYPEKPKIINVVYGTSVRAIPLCSQCISEITCGRCKRVIYKPKLIVIGNEYLCQECYSDVIKKQREEIFNIWEPSDLPKSGTILIEELPTRPTRTISIETEYDSSQPSVAAQLFKDLDLVERQERYSYTGDITSGYPAILKSDGSVTGGELVSFCLTLSHPEHAQVLTNVMAAVEHMKRNELINLSENAGGHIHIDLHGLSATDCANYAIVFDFLEDLFYTLGGSGSSYGHRSKAGNSYGPGLPRATSQEKKDKLRYISRISGGRYGLHLGYHRELMYHFDESRSCGPDKCTCGLTLVKGTAEWRIWNAQCHPKILHCWISLMQALTAWIVENPDINPDDFPAHKWSPTATMVSTTKSPRLVSLTTQLKFILDNFELTPDEKKSLKYTLEQSEAPILSKLITKSSRRKKFADQTAPNPMGLRKINKGI